MIIRRAGYHAALALPKPQSGAPSHEAALEDVVIIARMARRYRGENIARVPSELVRRTGKGNRRTQAGVAAVKQKCAIALLDVANLDPDIFALAKAAEYRGFSDTTLKRLIDAWNANCRVLAAEDNERWELKWMFPTCDDEDHSAARVCG